MTPRRTKVRIIAHTLYTCTECTLYMYIVHTLLFLHIVHVHILHEMILTFFHQIIRILREVRVLL